VPSALRARAGLFKPLATTFTHESVQIRTRSCSRPDDEALLLLAARRRSSETSAISVGYATETCGERAPSASGRTLRAEDSVTMNFRALAAALTLLSACGSRTKVELFGDYGGSSGTSDGGSSGTTSVSGGTNAQSGTSGAGAGGTGGTGAGPIYLYDADNYRALISLSIPGVETASGVDLDVCWSNVVSDLDCGVVDPRTEIVAAGMMRFRSMSEPAIEEVLASSELRMTELDGFLSYLSDHTSTCTALSSFSNYGVPVDFAEEYAPNDDLKYVFLFLRRTISGVASVTMTFARPSASSMNRELHAQPGCDMRALAAEVAPPVRVPFDGPWIVDFSNVTRDGQGYPFSPPDIDSATLWFFADSTLPDVEGLVSELDRRATDHYRFEFVETQSVSLSDFMTPAGDQPFPGFRRDQAGVWLFGLTCSYCLNPDIPHVLAVFEPREAL
jgi:hypothetical protein